MTGQLMYREDTGWAGEPTQRLPKRASKPLPPNEEPFYLAPHRFERHAPGTILRSREVTLALFGLVPMKVSAWQLLFRTTDLHGAPDAAVTTVLRHRAHALGGQPPLELPFIANAVARGWAVSIADHGGADGLFGAPREPGYRALDGIRAALAFAPLGLGPDAPIGLAGYSGGGMATSWAAEMAPTYAAELNIVGAALGAPVGDPGELFHTLNGNFFSGLSATVVAGLRHAYPGLNRLILEHSSPEGIRLLRELEGLNTIPAIFRFRNKNLDDFLDMPLEDFMSTPELAEMVDDIRLGHRSPACPLFVVQGMRDAITPVGLVDGQVQRYADGGTHVTYVRSRVGGHLALAPLSSPLMIAWLDDRFNGEPSHAGTETVLSVALRRTALLAYFSAGASAARLILGMRLGRC